MMKGTGLPSLQSPKSLGALFMGLCYLVTTTLAAEPAVSDVDAIPHVGKRARESYVDYLYADPHKAFAIGPGGAWAWQAGKASPQVAEQAAIEYCERYSQQKCVAYAVNDKLVFDSKQWSTLWGPYLSKAEAAQAPVGNKVGERFYDLAFKDEKGKRKTIADLRGKVVFIHFWGSWCPSCMIEFPSLVRLQKQLNQELGKQVELVILQAREPFSESIKWARKNGFADVTLYDSGVKSLSDTEMQLADGSRIQDREVAKTFPTSIVLDKNGIVVFYHTGPVNNWMEYIEFFRDSALAP
jgi:thiol-disulfide isomerase/thioredoxin